jgi:putative acetyltransferase
MRQADDKLIWTKIRSEGPQDWRTVFEVVSSAFGRNAEAELVRKLREGGDAAVSLVAEVHGQIVGHVMLSKLGASFPALALAPVSVIPMRQRCGVGSSLIKAALKCAHDDGWEAIFVLGDPNYYEPFGFSREAAAGFESPYAGPHFMMLRLSASLAATAGRLSHASAFASLD